jgi:hypothetical protein
MQESSISRPERKSAVQESRSSAPQPPGISQDARLTDELKLLSLAALFPLTSVVSKAASGRDELRERIEQERTQTFVGRLLQQLAAGEVPEADCADLLREIALIDPATFAAGAALYGDPGSALRCARTSPVKR